MNHAESSIRQAIARFDPHLPLNQAWTPPASWYVDPGFDKLDRRRVFRNRWLWAGRVDQVAHPGDFFTLQLAQFPLLITRDEQGQLRAFYNVCAHHGTRVAADSGCAERFTCPYHGWQYSLTGRLLKAPRAGAHQALKDNSLGLTSLPIRQVGPWIFVHPQHHGALSDQTITAAAPTGDDPLSGFMAAFGDANLEAPRFLTRLSYELPCNWKVFVDNYLDGGYHVPHMHPALGNQLNLKNYDATIHGQHVMQTCPTETASSEPQSGASRLGRGAYYGWLYPNFMVNRYGNWMDTNWVIPLSPDRCLTVFDYYYDGPLSDAERARCLAASDQVQQEDIAVCRMVQEGLASGVYDRGVYAPRFEAPMYHFHRLLHADYLAVP